MNENAPVASYSRVADRYDGDSNERSFWGELAREAYEAIVLRPRYRVIVDVGCGTGLALHHLQGRAPAHAKLIGIEPADQMRRLSEQRNAGIASVELRAGRFESLPLADASVDYLYSIWAFHWVSDPRRGADEIRRVLKDDGEIDLWFTGLSTGREFAQKAAEVLARYVDLETRLRAASMITSLDRDLVDDLFSSFESSGLTITEETTTHYDTLEAHWAWQIRSEAHYSVISPADRARFDAELRSAIESLGDERGVPYTRHSFHVRYRHVDRALLAVPAWMDDLRAATGADSTRRSVSLCTLAAESEEGLRRGADHLSAGLEQAPRDASSYGDIRATVTSEPGAGSHRLAVVAPSAETLVQGLRIAAQGGVPALGARGVVKRRPVVAFMFTGQGAERAGMGRALFETCPAFRAGIEECARRSDELMGASLVDLVCREADGPIHDDVQAKVALFALQYALAHLLRSWGVRPNVVVGHSLGEYAAACVAGVFPLDDAMRLLVDRGRVMRDHATSGSMCAVRASVEQIRPYLAPCAGRVVISAYNAPESLVLSGEAPALEILSHELAAQGIRTTPLQTHHAFHSPLMSAAEAPLRRACEAVLHSPPQIPFVSTVMGGKEVDVWSPEYWVRHMLEPVQFEAAVDTLKSRGVSAYVEIGPGATLINLVAQCIGEGAAICAPSLGGQGDPWPSLLSSLGALHVQGVEIDWERFSFPGSPRVMDLSLDGLEQGQAASRVAGPPASAWARRLEGEPPAGRLRVARKLVRAEVAELLGREIGEQADYKGLMELGVDSLRSVALSRNLADRIRQRVSETLTFSRPNIDALARFVLQALSLEIQEDDQPVGEAASPDRRDDEPIAIVGTGCRLPGGVVDLAGLWTLLEGGKETVGPLPDGRFDVATWLASDAEASGKSSVLDASYLQDVASFDPGFFGISPREARCIDPVHRLLLEVCWEALEDAAVIPGALVGSETGVFVGIGPSEYHGARPEMTAPDMIDAYAGLGTSPSVGVGRISYSLGLMGPCVAVDTACSSSLVAVHLACRSLRAGECTMALAGGVSLLLSPSTFVWLSKSRALAADGRCKTFSADADGYGRGEGGAVVVLKTLSRARADGDRILAVIRGSAINHDGASSGLTVPNGRAQEAVIRRALSDAGCAPQSVGYVETHGTGTPLGDPIEVEALNAVYGDGRSAATPLLLGSVKTNLGHLEYGAGIAGLLKVVLALGKQQIPTHIHMRAPNPRIDWGNLPLAIPEAQTPWPGGDAPRRAAVSAFGLSGTNAHVIVEQAPPVPPVTAAPERSAELLVVSARSAKAVEAAAARLSAHLTAHPEQSLHDLAFSLATTRSPMEHRLAIAATSREELQAALDAAARGETPKGVVRGSVPSGGAPKVVFVFPGQGSQWVGMGRELLAAEPVFRTALTACDRAIQAEAGFSLLAELNAGESASRLDRIDVVQPVLFAMAVALAALWRSWGVEPDAVVGHSMGEVAAAHVAGALSLADAVAIICRRSLLLRRISGQGQMAVVELSLGDAQSALRGYEDRLSVAVSNSPRSTVLSGEPSALAAVLSALEARGVFCRRVKVDVASHSPQVDWLREDLLTALTALAPRPCGVPMRSTVTGAIAEGPELLAGYWADNLRQPVRFAEVVQALLESGHGLFVEMSPHPILTTSVEEIQQASTEEGAVVGSLRRGQAERPALLESLGSLWAQGYPLDWKRLFPAGGRRVPLPTYAWQRARYWIDAKPSGRRFAAADPLADWFYRMDWPEVPRAAVESPQAASGSWLVLADKGGFGEAVASALSRRGLSCTVLVASAEASAVAEQVAEAARARSDLQGVVYLGGLDAEVDAEASSGEVGAVTHRAAAPVLGLARFLSSAPHSARLWMVTRGACAVGGEPDVAPCQAALWGLGRVAALEHPAAWGGLVDLDPRGSATEVEALVTELLSPDDEDQLAFRAGRRHAARLVSAPPEGPATPLSLSAEASYLVTGGLGGLGLQVARWLVERGARHLVLTSRHGLPARATWREDLAPEVRTRVTAIEALEARGARVTVAAVDVAEAEPMAALLDGLDPPLRGVVHAAGVGPARSLAETDEALLASTLRPKVAGSWVLHRLLRDQPLDLFVLFSSGAAVWGGHSQGAYAAANAFLDGLSYHRRSQGLLASSIAWGLWTEGGLADAETQSRLSGIGVLPMATASALSAMERLVGTAQRTVTRMDWPVFASVYTARRRRNLLVELVPREDPSTSPHEASAGRSWRGLSVEESRVALRALVRGIVARVLGFTDPGALDAGRGFNEQGLDSLMAVEMRNRLQKELGVPLSATLAFDHPTVERLVAYLLTDVLKLEEQGSPQLVRSMAMDEPIAIVGAACRLPGGADDVETYWQLLAEGVVAATHVPAHRWSAADWYDPDPEAPGRTYVTQAGFLRDVERFDAAFFRISPREAMSLDPQQRLLLEVSWEALERAGQDPTALHDSPTGVFVGVGANEYAQRLDDEGGEQGTYGTTGNMLGVAAGRLSFFLGLHGPTLAVDTACSSSLVALHLACQSLRQGECGRALVGGVNTLLTPRAFVALSRLRALSPEGRCKTFSASADGYGRAEGCVVVVLKRLSEAQRDGDRILAVIRGTAINHDGASSGLTVPNGPAQQTVMMQALAQAGVAPAEVDFVECHGTGTSLGDPIEVQALSAVYGQGRPADRPLGLGAAKANVGHLEAASGLVGVLKVVAALGHEQIPGQPALGELNPLLPWETLPVAVARESSSWARGERPRLAGVSAFGLSGTNAHVVLEEAPAMAPAPSAPERAAELFVLSAKSAAALDAQAARLRDHLDAHPSQSLGDMAFSLATTRSAMEHRLAVAATSREALQAALQAAAEGQTLPGVVRGVVAPSRGKLACLFTGQGAQTPGMGRGLHEAWPAFREAFDRCVALFDQELDRPLREVMWAEPGSAEAALLDQTAYTQPALFALEYALFALWRSWGIEPDLVAGHSIGELVAACVAGVFSLEDAVRLVAARGRLMQALPAGGAMVSIAAPEAEVAAAVAPHAASVSIAAVNGPEQVVIAGAEEAVEAIASAFASRGVRTKALTVSHAFHSPRMAPMLEAFGRVAESVTYQALSIPLVSNVTGTLCTDEVRTAVYWVHHVREAVRFSDGVKALHAAGASVFLEVGPKPTLLGLVPACLPEASPTLLASLRAGRDEASSVLEALGGIWALGGAVGWSGVFPAGGQRVSLPTYPWQRERYWIEAADHALHRAGESTGHPLLGVRLPVAGGGAVFETVLGVSSPPWLADHRVAGQVIMAGAALAELVRAAAAAHDTASMPRVAGLVLQTPLTLPQTGARRVQVVLGEPGAEGVRVSVFSQPAQSRAGEAWTLHASATVTTEAAAAPAPLDLAGLRSRCPEPMDVEAAHADLAEAGLAFGPAFQGLRSLWRGDGESLAEVALPAGMTADGYGVFPPLLDAAFQAVIGASPAGVSEELLMVFELGSFVVHQPGAEVTWVHTQLRSGAGSAGAAADVTLADAAGAVVAQVTELRLQRVDRDALRRQRAGAPPDTFYRLEWCEAQLPEAPPARPGGSWVVVAAPGSERAKALVARLVQSTLTEPTGLAATLATTSPLAGVICLWERGAEEEVPAAAQRVATDGLLVAQALQNRAPVRLWWVTRGAVAVEPGEAVDVGAAPVWGLGRTVMQEHPELGCTLVDLEAGAESLDGLERELSAPDGETQVAWRAGRRYVARLSRVHAIEALPDSEDYQLSIRSKGTLDGLCLAPAERRAPGPGEVQIEVRASGLNFRDVLNTLGMYPGEAGPLGGECAGVVVGVGVGVQSASVGDRVMAFVQGAFQRFVTVDARLVAPMPVGLSFTQAAAVPIVFLTAWYALHDLGELKAGERLLVHAAAGGVGMAAVQLGRWMGAEVLATASPSKWEVVRSLGVTHVASSRTPEFATTLRRGRGVDVVLNALAGELVDASLSLLSAGGRLLEMGKTDVRDPAAVAAAHPGVRYRAFDLLEAGPDRIREMLASIHAGLTAGHLKPLPVRAFPITEAESAFRFMGQARHVGKLVLVPPAPSRARSDSTVVLTGGLGALGFYVARWLAQQGVAHLVLTGRRGLETPGAAEAVAELTSLGARVTVAAVDVADRGALSAVLDAIPAQWPLRGVVHAAGVLDDGVLAEQDAARFARVLSPKVAGAWNLHTLTEAHALDFFVLFSSASGLLGAAGQGNYAAANTFLDALAAHRRALGLPAQSLAWGPWVEGGMAAGLGAPQQARLARQGTRALSSAEGIALFEQALQRPEAQLGVLRLDLSTVRRALGATVPPVWRALVRAPAARPATSVAQEAWSLRLAALPSSRREEEVRAAVQGDIARVLSLGAASAVPLDRPLSELGLDSLMAVELRNALGQRVGAPLPATLAFDYPTTSAIATYLLDEVLGFSPKGPSTAAPPLSDAEIRRALDSISVAELRGTGLLDELLHLTKRSSPAQPGDTQPTANIDDMDADELLRRWH